jgi:hypothetical protein
MKRRSKRKALSSSLPIPLIILGIRVVLVVVAVILLVQTGDTGNITPETIQRVSAAETKRAYESGQAIILDVRSRTAYEDQRIPGSINIPLEELDQRLGELDKEQWVIAYCT